MRDLVRVTLALDPPTQIQDAHWNEEAKALLAGLILLTVCYEEPPQRHLGTLREHLPLPPDRFTALLALMQGSTAAGFISPRVGRPIDQRGGRPVLATSALLLAAGLCGLAAAPSLPLYLMA